MSLVEAKTQGIITWDEMSQEKLSIAMSQKIPVYTPLNETCEFAEKCPYLIAPCEVCTYSDNLSCNCCLCGEDEANHILAKDTPAELNVCLTCRNTILKGK
jgi:hypothetical protein